MSAHNPNVTNRPFSVVEYDPNWPGLYEGYARTIAGIFGDTLLEMYHLGSTSIPGMFAKPNIDIYVLVKNLADVRNKYEQLTQAGFACRGDYSHIGEEYFTIDTISGERIASVHVFEGSGDIFKEYKNFRDYLITHDDVRERYISLKRELYAKFQNDYKKYDEGKQSMLSEIRARANEWVNTK